MIEMERLAHRGFWTTPNEKNSRIAFERAFKARYGIETDLRDHCGEVVISHDPPGIDGEPEMTLQQFLELRADLGATGTLALNIKADGLSAKVSEVLKQYQVNKYFVFDMSIPDMLSYLKLRLKCFSRQSEFESPIVFQKDTFGCATRGIWLDSFEPIWYSTKLVRDHLAAGLDVCLVSPELHGQDPGSWWDELKVFIESTQLDKSQEWGTLMLCTDFPDKF